MQLRADIQLRAVVKALKDTIAPAVDAENKLASEQLQMVIGALTIVAQNLPLQFSFDCNELRRLVELAHSIAGLTASNEDQSALDEIGQAADQGALVLGRAKADPGEVLDAVRDLRAKCSAATTALYNAGSPDSRKALTETVVAYSQAQTLRDRSWLLNMGFETAHSGLPPIEDLLVSDADALVNQRSSA